MAARIIMNEVTDRIPGNPGRVLITPEDGSMPYYATVAIADNPIQEGTPINKALFDSMAVCIDGLEPVTWGVGDIRTTNYHLTEYPVGDYLLCDGREIDLNDFPQLKERWDYV